MRVDVPEYNTFIDFPDDATPETISQVMSQNFPAKQIKAQPAPQEQGMIQRRIGNISNPTPSAVRDFSPTLGSALNVAGQTGGVIVDTIGAGLKKGYDLLPESVQGAIKHGSSRIAENPLVDAAGTLFKAAPEGVQNDIGRIADASMIIPGIQLGRIGLKGAKEGVNIARDVGAITGASKIPGKAINATKNFIKPTPTKDQALGQIIQGKTKDIVKGEKALSSIDTRGVNSYDDLSVKLKGGISNYARQVDDELLKDPKIYTIDELATASKTKGGQIVEKNHVQEALANLDELYGKTGDAVKQAEIGELLNKATTEGLTKKEVNDLARQYGIEFKSKAFGKLGDPLTSVNAQMYENTRSGLKEVARRGLSQKAKDLDSTISSLYNTDRLISKNVEAVNRLRQRIDERGLGEKIGRRALDVMDMATMGMVKGAALRLFPRGLGYKVKNFIDLEDSLGRNLKIFNKALDAKNDIELVDTLKSNFGKYVSGKMEGRKIPLAKEAKSAMMFAGEKPHEWIKNQLNQLQTLSREAGTITPGEITTNQRDIAARINNALKAEGLSTADKTAALQEIDRFFETLNSPQKDQLKRIMLGYGKLTSVLNNESGSITLRPPKKGTASDIPAKTTP